MTTDIIGKLSFREDFEMLKSGTVRLSPRCSIRATG